MKKLTVLCESLVCSATMMAQQAPQLRADNINEVIKAMTLEEKSQLVVGTGMQGITSNLGQFSTIVPGAAGTTISIPRLGIPAIVLSDGPAGVRINPTRDFDSKTYYCTHFPIGTVLSSTWDINTVQAVGAAIGSEVRAYGADVLLGPGVCLMRNPLCGRNFEYYSEDPVLSGNIAAAYINGVQSKGVGTSIKHFAFNSQETARLGNDARVSQRAGRELYLKNFEIAIKKSQPWTVMSSYNNVNGVMASERRDLLTTILRDEWGFKGLVMTDWAGGNDPIWRDGKNDRAANMIAGNDLIEPGDVKDSKAIAEAVRSGKLNVKYLDECVKRVLELVVKTPRFKGYVATDNPNLTANAQVARTAASEGTVLLENRGALPFGQGVKNVALYGIASYDPISGGTGSGNVNRAYTISLVEGMRNANLIVDQNILNTYKKWIAEQKVELAKVKREWWQTAPLAQEFAPKAADVEAAAKANDVAVITIQRLSGEGTDRTDKDFNLTNTELQMIKTVTDAFHAQGKTTVVVLNIGGVIESASWKNIPDAILLPWQCGQEIGNAVADMLTGKVAPSGKLPMTWPVSFNDVPSSKNFPKDGVEVNPFVNNPQYRTVKNIGYTNYDEDIYVGYRYFDTFKQNVSYPFGYGLTYTTFTYNNVKAVDNGNNINVTVTITNNGKRAGKEVVELYVTAPKGAVEKPAQELKAFGKTKLLQPGESQTLTLSVSKADLASFNTAKSAWVADAGTYTFKVGASSRDIKGEAKLNLKVSSQKVANVVAPKVKLDLLHQ